jgi:transcriptional regulator with XRE-family HTH domain
VARRLEETLATRLRELAAERKLPISHVADRCGLAHSYFWQLLAGNASASLAVVQRLAEALDVDPLALLSPRAATKSGVRRKDQGDGVAQRPWPTAAGSTSATRPKRKRAGATRG